MPQGFQFYEPQPVILDGTDGLPVVGVYPPTASFDFEPTDEGWVSVELPSPDGPLTSEFPTSAGFVVPAVNPQTPDVMSFRAGAARFPGLISPEALEDYENARRVMKEWQ